MEEAKEYEVDDGAEMEERAGMVGDQLDEVDDGTKREEMAELDELEAVTRPSLHH
jgi:hypothetical protein